MSLQETGLATDGDEFVDELKPGTELMHGQYTIEGFLAAGGFGITYLAKDSLNRRVVIKECFPGNLCRRKQCSVTPRSRAHQNELKSIVRLFSQEAMSLAKANHPNIVGVHQVFEENNTAYMALDFVQGRDLLEILEDDPESLKPELVEGYLVKVLDAIKHIHNLGMLHRDISPDNVIINEMGEPILIDFGAAREGETEKATRMLSALRVVKDGYSPQEFYIAGSDQTPSCDLYSLAASFYHLITGELPPDSQWRLSACAAGDEDPYVSLGEKTDAYSKNFITGLDKAIAILPRDRMQNAEEWIDHIKNPEVVVSEILSTQADFMAATGKKPIIPILLGTTALAAAAGIGFFYVSSTESVEAPVVEPVGQAIAAADVPISAPAPAAVPAPDNQVAPELSDLIAGIAPITADPVEATSVEPIDLAAVEPVEPTPVETEEEASGVPDVSTPELSSEPAELAGIPVVEPRPEIESPDVALAVEEPTRVAPVVPDLPEVTEFTTEVAVLSLPAAAIGSVDFTLPTTVLGIPEASRELLALEGPAAALQDGNPAVDTTAPAALVVPEPVLDVAQGQAPAEEDNVATGVEFFVAMAAKQPELISAPSSQVQRVTPVARPTRSAVVENSQVISSVLPKLPFSLSVLTPGVIVSGDAGATGWLADNERIISVNGQPVTTNEQITENLEAAARRANANSFDVTLGLNAGLKGAASERTLTIATERHTQLLNGLSFVSRENGSTWSTEVTNVPSSSNFQVGDTIVSYIATWQNLDEPNSMKTILDQELAKGKSSFSFAVSRGQEIWIESFDLASVN